MKRLQQKRDGNIYLKNGESLSFECFFRENFAKFQAFAGRFINDPYAGEDIVQEAFISVWESERNSYDSELMVQAFIYKTIRNKCLNYIKYNKIREKYSNEFIHGRESETYLLHSILNEEVQHALYAAIKKLTPQCQIVIKLHLEGKKNKDIAEIMNISEITVKSHKMLAYKELRAILRPPLSLILFFSLKKLILTHTIPLLNCFHRKHLLDGGNHPEYKNRKTYL